MKLRYVPSIHDRISRLGQWHNWYAWRPVRVGKNDWRWLEFVDRKCDAYFGNEYRATAVEDKT